ncbi:unnamed protein product [Anisakis simplex]|uniref:BAR domain-containing protein n=1 Tax=Anisakis simplex TaxID=6269 RepID=A0A0M3JXI7_ANISI|nr:unnamed protein product [Anisakis simplex]
MSDAGNAEEDKKKKERGPVGRMLFKMVCFFRNDTISCRYQDAVEKTVVSLESVLQNDAKILADGSIECAEKMDPYEKFAKNIKAFRQFQPEDKKESTVTVEAIVKRLALMHRETQLKGSKMRRFIAGDRASMMEDQKKLMKARDIMDAARHEVKQARTNEMVEEKGKFYERCVHEFDTQAAKVASYPEKLPEDKESHSKEILEVTAKFTVMSAPITRNVFQYFEVLSNYHRNAAAMLSEHLQKLGVQSPIDAAASIN